ncbi:MAG TPA: DUF2335 domain-containing protein [Hyphomicrobiales bacterium]|nr:DUF2335 domain-containing protein [Hyphomicrobiales bacterium]
MSEMDDDQPPTPKEISDTRSEAQETTSPRPAERTSEHQVPQFFGWKGPLPPPQALAAFDDVVENGAERVFKQFENEGNHRRKMERLHLTAQVQDLRLGKMLAFVFVMSMIGTAIYAISSGYPTLAGILGGGVLTSVVWAFVRIASDGNPEVKQDT